MERFCNYLLWLLGAAHDCDPVFVLTGVEKVVGWALSHHFMHCTEVLVKDSKLVISTERLSTFSGPLLIVISNFNQGMELYTILLFS